MLDFRKYRNFSRILFKINLFSAFVFFLLQIYIYKLLIQEPHTHYYVQTNNGFMFPVNHIDLSSPDKPIITTHFQ
jgi:hypothetical protein